MRTKYLRLITFHLKHLKSDTGEGLDIENTNICTKPFYPHRRLGLDNPTVATAAKVATLLNTVLVYKRVTLGGIPRRSFTITGFWSDVERTLEVLDVLINAPERIREITKNEIYVEKKANNEKRKKMLVSKLAIFTAYKKSIPRKDTRSPSAISLKVYKELRKRIETGVNGIYQEFLREFRDISEKRIIKKHLMNKVYYFLILHGKLKYHAHYIRTGSPTDSLHAVTKTHIENCIINHIGLIR
jgi:hypothetical protein